MGEGKREFEYLGPLNQPTPRTKPQAALSPDSARRVIVGAWTMGRIQITPHFSRRGRERYFDVLDAESVARNGKIRGIPEFCPIFKNWKYKMHGHIEGRTLEIVVALDPAEDYSECPLLVLITGYWLT